MALSFEDEIRGFLQHSLEQNPQMFQALKTGRHELSTDEAVRFLASMMFVQSEALGRVAREIDNLRAAILGG